jgi:FAD/FMN-containing dehydrogenase
MDGTKTGLGINRSPAGAKKLIVFMQGGGACFSGQTCALSDIVLSTDHHDETDFAAWAE